MARLRPTRLEEPVDEDHEHRQYWETFYAGSQSSAVPRSPSSFAEWVASRESVPGPLVDVGMGNGRDALWFSRCGFDVLGLDFADSAVRLATDLATSEGLAVSFARVNLYHQTEVSDAAALMGLDLRPRVLYARFFVHALEDDARLNLWRMAREALGAGGRLYLEFRVTATQHEFGEHYRHFVHPDTVAAEIEALGGRIEHREEGHGLAVYKDEDPRVCRIVARW